METQKMNVHEHFIQRKESEIKRWFSATNGINWNPERLKKYEDRIDWTALSGNTSVKLDVRLFLEFSDKWDWEKISNRIPLIKNKVDFVLILGRFKDKLNWSDVCSSIHMDSKIVEAFPEYIDWSVLCRNQYFMWENPFIEKHVNSMEWDVFSEFVRFQSFKLMRIMKQNHRGDNTLSSWMIGTIKHFKEHWNWEKLSKNRRISFTPTMIEAFKDKWNWQNLMGNRAMNWDIDVVNKYSTYIPELEQEQIEHSFLWESLVKQEFMNTTETDLELIIDKGF